MSQSINEIKEILAPWRLIILTCSGSVPFSSEIGYAGESMAQSFEFREVLNKNEHFSNISDPPETKIHIIYYADVIDLKRHS